MKIQNSIKVKRGLLAKINYFDRTTLNFSGRRSQSIWILIPNRNKSIAFFSKWNLASIEQPKYFILFVKKGMPSQIYVAEMEEHKWVF